MARKLRDAGARPRETDPIAAEHVALLQRHREDIQGLRAIAVVVVVLNHAGVGFAKGGYIGVDVFFVLSGFLITGVLLHDVAGREHVSLPRFYARRARRILPAATLTLLATGVAAYLLMNFVRAAETLKDEIWAALFVANVRFAEQGTDYFAQAQPPSPIQHYWSLAVEEQFYLVWPAVVAVLLGVGLTRRNRSPGVSRPLPRLYLGLALIAAGSLAWSVYGTHTHPTSTYFSTGARAWELALGAGLACAAPAFARVATPWRLGLGWLGLAGIGLATVFCSATTPFPGYMALFPTVAAVCVIAAGIGPALPRSGAGAVLGIAPLRYVGDRSYAFYLWHWPVLTIASLYFARDLSVSENLALLGGAFLLSIVSYRLVENPMRRMKWPTQLAPLVLWPASVVSVLVVAGVFLAPITNEEVRRADAAVTFPAAQSSAASATPRADRESTDQARTSRPTPDALPQVIAAVKAAKRGDQIPTALHPPIATLTADHYDYPSGCSTHDGEVKSRLCNLGAAAGGRSLVVFGDSHAQMFMPAILPLADTDEWSVRPIGKSACSPNEWIGAEGNAECRAWYKWAVDQAQRLRPDVVLIAGTFADGASLEGIARTAAKMQNFTRRTVILGDPPAHTRQPLDCLLARNATLRRCMETPSPLSVTLAEGAASTARQARARFLDTSRWFCSANSCPLVIGNTIAYSDKGHVSKTYASELAGPFAVAFRRATASIR